MTSLKNTILESVKKNEIGMIPKWKIILYSSLGIVSVVFVFLLSVFLGSLFLFILSRHGFMDLPFFVFLSTVHTLSVLPILLLLLLTLLLIILIELIAKRYEFARKRPLVISLMVIASLSLLVSYAVMATPLHERIREHLHKSGNKKLMHMYDRPAPFKKMKDGRDALRGKVVAVSSTSTTLKTFDGSIITAYFANGVGTSSLLVIDNDVVIFGNRNEEGFMMYDVRTPKRPPFEETREFLFDKKDGMREFESIER
jgi:hypothetical protein